MKACSLSPLCLHLLTYTVLWMSRPCLICNRVLENMTHSAGLRDCAGRQQSVLRGGGGAVRQSHRHGAVRAGRQNPQAGRQQRAKRAARRSARVGRAGGPCCSSGNSRPCCLTLCHIAPDSRSHKAYMYVSSWLLLHTLPGVWEWSNLPKAVVLLLALNACRSGRTLSLGICGRPADLEGREHHTRRAPCSAAHVPQLGWRGGVSLMSETTGLSFWLD